MEVTHLYPVPVLQQLLLREVVLEVPVDQMYLVTPVDVEEQVEETVDQPLPTEETVQQAKVLEEVTVQMTAEAVEELVLSVDNLKHQEMQVLVVMVYL